MGSSLGEDVGGDDLFGCLLMVLGGMTRGLLSFRIRR